MGIERSGHGTPCENFNIHVRKIRRKIVCISKFNDCESKQYDFITCTETAEHFYDPFKEFNTFNDLLKPGGWLGIMTSFLTTDDKFENWYYRRDPTHVTFYCEKTFQVMASQRDWTCEIRSKDVVLMQKKYD